MQKPEEIRDQVREGYAAVAKNGSSCCAPSCCSPTDTARATAERAGYSAQDLDGAAAEANLGLGCGNPTALADLAEGEVVVDLGAGAGFDALIAGPKVGPTGRVIGVDMTPEMLARARKNAVDAGLADRVEFREGIIEDLPVVSGSADVVISNCVINLSPDKPQAFREAFRVLKPGGRLAVSDLLLTEPLPDGIAELAAAWIACVGGAMLVDDYLGAIEDAGFVDIAHTRKPAAAMIEGYLDDPIARQAIALLGEERVRKVAQSVYSYSIEAKKP